MIRRRSVPKIKTAPKIGSSTIASLLRLSVVTANSAPRNFTAASHSTAKSCHVDDGPFRRGSENSERVCARIMQKRDRGYHEIMSRDRSGKSMTCGKNQAVFLVVALDSHCSFFGGLLGRFTVAGIAGLVSRGGRDRHDSITELASQSA